MDDDDDSDFIIIETAVFLHRRYCLLDDDDDSDFIIIETAVFLIYIMSVCVPVEKGLWIETSWIFV